MEELLKKIYSSVTSKQEIKDMENLMYMCKEALKKEDTEEIGRDYLIKLSDYIEEIMPTYKDPVKLYAMHKRVAFAGARYSFHLYLLAMEWTRSPEKRFYIPRKRVLRQVVDSMQQLADKKLDLLAISLPPGVGKLLADSTPVLTTSGWKNHGDLQVGDYVYNQQGKPVKVVAVVPKYHTTHTVTLTDGSQYKCHFNHEWKVYDRRSQKEKIVETKYMIGNEHIGDTDFGRGHRYRFMIPFAEPIIGEEKELPVKPYSLGVWLGDGKADAPTISNSEEDSAVIDSMVADGYTIRHVWVHKTTGVLYTFFNGLREDLEKCGMCISHKSEPKRIPEEYLTASINQRLELLAGLIDTDGTANKKEHSYAYSTTSESLRDGVCELVSTFGWRYSLSKYEPKISTSGVVGRKPVYVIKFCPYLEIPCRLERKKINEFAKRRRVAVKEISPSEQEQGNCIMVEGDGMYLAGRNMRPTHNTTLAIFYLTWMGGRIPDKPMLTGSHSNSFIRGVYDECLRMMDENGEYHWHEIFPEVPIASTNAKDCRIDLGKSKRFETLEFTSIGTGNAGLYRAVTLLYCDDLVSGIEVALSKERLDKLWEIYTTDLRQRKQGDGVPELIISTRWSVADVIGRLEGMYGDSDRAKFLVIPALDENDESNFDYAYGVGFSTKTYHEQREIMDEVSWKALYMNQPIEREGLVYPADELRRYFDLPDGDPDAIIGVCDTKDKGTDYAFLPVGYQYGENFYIHDCVCDNGLPDIVDARLTEVLLRNKVQQCRFESNSAGGRVAQKVQEDVKAKGGVTHITTKFTTANKETKIIVNSSWVKEHCLFKDESLYKKQSDYGKMMNFLTSYTMAGKNKTDDVPDGMAMFALFAQGFGMASVNIIRRPF